MIPTIEKVQKEEIKNLEFVHHDVLTNSDDKKIRKASVDKAMILGNGYKGKVKIIFDTVSGTKEVETTIWSADENEVMLKGGVNIPLQSIREVMI